MESIYKISVGNSAVKEIRKRCIKRIEASLTHSVNKKTGTLCAKQKNSSSKEMAGLIQIVKRLADNVGKGTCETEPGIRLYPRRGEKTERPMTYVTIG